MSAKHKLNAAHCYGALPVAGLLGWVTGSLGVFLIALVALLVANYHAGDMRRRTTRRRQAPASVSHPLGVRTGGGQPLPSTTPDATRRPVSLPKSGDFRYGRFRHAHSGRGRSRQAPNPSAISQGIDESTGSFR